MARAEAEINRAKGRDRSETPLKLQTEAAAYAANGSNVACDERAVCAVEGAWSRGRRGRPVAREAEQTARWSRRDRSVQALSQNRKLLQRQPWSAQKNGKMWLAAVFLWTEDKILARAPISYCFALANFCGQARNEFVSMLVPFEILINIHCQHFNGSRPIKCGDYRH